MLPITLYIEVDGVKREVDVSPALDGKPVVITGSGAPYKVIAETTVQPSGAPLIVRQKYPGGFDDNGNSFGIGKNTVYVNYPGAKLFVGVEIDYQTVATRWNGTISDNGDIDPNVQDARKLGFNTMRVWRSWNPTTGALNGDLSIPNGLVKAGLNAFICFTPSMNAASVAYPAAAIATIIATLDKRVVVEIINEPNLVYTDEEGKEHSYWPRGNAPEAMAVASRISAELKAAGFKTASPALTVQMPSVIALYWKQFIANGWTNFDYINGHNYPVIQPWASGLTEAVANFKEVLLAYKAVADQLGKPLMLSEWGMYNDKTKFAEAWPQLDAMVKRYTQASAYYIMRELPNNTKYGLHLIDAAGNYTALGNAVKAVAQS